MVGTGNRKDSKGKNNEFNITDFLVCCQADFTALRKHLMPLLRVQHVTVRLDGQVDDLFRDVSLEINPHDRIGGKRGAGRRLAPKTVASDE